QSAFRNRLVERALVKGDPDLSFYGETAGLRIVDDQLVDHRALLVGRQLDDLDTRELLVLVVEYRRVGDVRIERQGCDDARDPRLLEVLGQRGQRNAVHLRQALLLALQCLVRVVVVVIAEDAGKQQGHDDDDRN